ncbi:uncharacterized protein LOC131161264 isoform X2 [Malania oleifera]|uniref:uncharacterized protein LOC131161264 isoform X2 n=1 Tax=Malania oleifera TaxID=397392 RepID=UPI0025ADFA71|nr:uncharacterized protein LOC131161264 isoform X2 [Malania oleifera]
MDFHSMKRKELQALCKKHSIPANLTNLEMANRLSLLLKENENPITRFRSCLKNLGEIAHENDSKDVARKLKKVRFSPENDMIEFVNLKTDTGEESPMVMTRAGRRRSCMLKHTSAKEGLVTENVNSVEPFRGVTNNPVRTTRSIVQNSKVDDVPIDGLPLDKKKNARRGMKSQRTEVKNDDSSDEPPLVELGSDVGFKNAHFEEAGGVARRRLRNGEVAGDNSRDGDNGAFVGSKKNPMQKSSRKRGRNSDHSGESKTTAGDGISSEPVKVLRRSKRNLEKAENSELLSGPSEKGQMLKMHTQPQVTGASSGVDSKTVHGIIRQRCKTVAELKDDGIERLKPNEVSPLNGRLRRSRRNTSIYKSIASTAGGIGAHETIGRNKPAMQLKKPLLEREGEANMSDMHSKVFKDNSQDLRLNSSGLDGVINATRKKKSLKRTQKQTQEGVIPVNESGLIVDKPLKRSTCNASKHDPVMPAGGKAVRRKKQQNRLQMPIFEVDVPSKESGLIPEESAIVDAKLSAPEAARSLTSLPMSQIQEAPLDIDEGKLGLWGKSHVNKGSTSMELCPATSELDEDKELGLVSLEGTHTPESVKSVTAGAEQELQISESFVARDMENILQGHEQNLCQSDTHEVGRDDQEQRRDLSYDNVAELEPLEHQYKLSNALVSDAATQARGFSPVHQLDYVGKSAVTVDWRKEVETEKESSADKHSHVSRGFVVDHAAEDDVTSVHKEQNLVKSEEPRGSAEPVIHESVIGDLAIESNESEDTPRNFEDAPQEAREIGEHDTSNRKEITPMERGIDECEPEAPKIWETVSAPHITTPTKSFLPIHESDYLGISARRLEQGRETEAKEEPSTGKCINSRKGFVVDHAAEINRTPVHKEQNFVKFKEQKEVAEPDIHDSIVKDVIEFYESGGTKKHFENDSEARGTGKLSISEGRKITPYKLKEREPEESGYVAPHIVIEEMLSCKTPSTDDELELEEYQLQHLFSITANNANLIEKEEAFDHKAKMRNGATSESETPVANVIVGRFSQERSQKVEKMSENELEEIVYSASTSPIVSKVITDEIPQEDQDAGISRADGGFYPNLAGFSPEESIIIEDEVSGGLKMQCLKALDEGRGMDMHQQALEEGREMDIHQLSFEEESTPMILDETDHDEDKKIEISHAKDEFSADVIAVAVTGSDTKSEHAGISHCSGGTVPITPIHDKGISINNKKMSNFPEQEWNQFLGQFTEAVAMTDSTERADASLDAENCILDEFACGSVDVLERENAKGVKKEINCENQVDVVKEGRDTESSTKSASKELEDGKGVRSANAKSFFKEDLSQPTFGDCSTKGAEKLGVTTDDDDYEEEIVERGCSTKGVEKLGVTTDDDDYKEEIVERGCSIEPHRSNNSVIDDDADMEGIHREANMERSDHVIKEDNVEFFPEIELFDHNGSQERPAQVNYNSDSGLTVRVRNTTEVSHAVELVKAEAQRIKRINVQGDENGGNMLQVSTVGVDMIVSGSGDEYGKMNFSTLNSSTEVGAGVSEDMSADTAIELKHKDGKDVLEELKSKVMPQLDELIASHEHISTDFEVPHKFEENNSHATAANVSTSPEATAEGFGECVEEEEAGKAPIGDHVGNICEDKEVAVHSSHIMGAIKRMDVLKEVENGRTSLPVSLMGLCQVVLDYNDESAKMNAGAMDTSDRTICEDGEGSMEIPDEVAGIMMRSGGLKPGALHNHKEVDSELYGSAPISSFEPISKNTHGADRKGYVATIEENFSLLHTNFDAEKEYGHASLQLAQQNFGDLLVEVSDVNDSKHDFILDSVCKDGRVEADAATDSIEPTPESPKRFSCDCSWNLQKSAEVKSLADTSPSKPETCPPSLLNVSSSHGRGALEFNVESSLFSDWEINLFSGGIEGDEVKKTNLENSETNFMCDHNEDPRETEEEIKMQIAEGADVCEGLSKPNPMMADQHASFFDSEADMGITAEDAEMFQPTFKSPQRKNQVFSARNLNSSMVKGGNINSTLSPGMPKSSAKRLDMKENTPYVKKDQQDSITTGKTKKRQALKDLQAN